ncbi:MAG: class I SAM-dependent methyltransferase [Thermoplasmatales archaeon]|nr:class I SAM-dependent methyltransferase [Thermoplasmatales archaeon]MCW6170313.1 class I SAM-dependent methyltransferase [Thermoplasmatales archaeon]
MNDFSQLDFEKLWSGRDNVTRVENAIILSMIKSHTGSTALEIGAGKGRIANVISDYFGTYFALDYIPEFLMDIQVKDDQKKIIKIRGNLYKMPVSDNSIDVVLMIRVFNFLDEPQKALDEIYRVIRPGGIAVISFFNTGSVSEIFDTLFRNENDEYDHARSMKRDKVRVRRSNFTEYFYSRALFRHMAQNSGFFIREIRVSGMEDYRPFKYFPWQFFAGLSDILKFSKFIPHTFVLMSKSGKDNDLVFYEEDILCCPDCHSSINLDSLFSCSEVECTNCHHRVGFRDGIIFS